MASARPGRGELALASEVALMVAEAGGEAQRFDGRWSFTSASCDGTGASRSTAPSTSRHSTSSGAYPSSRRTSSVS